MRTEKKEIQFSQLTIPDEVLKMKDLPPTAKSIFGLLLTSCIQNNSNETFDYPIKLLAKLLNKTGPGIEYNLGKLYKKRLIEWKRKVYRNDKGLRVSTGFKVKKYFQKTAQK